VAELCDGLDNDCDATTDEDFAIGQICTAIGECGDGLFECKDLNSAICSTDPNGSQPGDTPETCDGLDNNCDGSTDEGGICITQFQIVSHNNPGEGLCDLVAVLQGVCDPNSLLCTAPPASVGRDCSEDPNTAADPNNPGPDDSICDTANPGYESCVAGFPAKVNDPNFACTTNQECDSVLDCSDPKVEVPRIVWDRASFDRFRPQIAWDPSFAKKKRIQSYVALTGDFWEPNGKKWKKACRKALRENPGNPILYLRVKGKDLDVPKSDPFRNAITPTVTVPTSN
jgi:hypothetical protein